MTSLPPSTKKGNLSKNFALAVVFFIIAVVATWYSSTKFYAVTIKSEDHDYSLRVELADTDAKREQGLMFRKTLTPDKGMLFVFPTVQKLSFWMKNTLIPLDLIFIQPDGRIDFIKHNAQPLDETPIADPTPAIAVLEIAGGQADKHGVKVGDIVQTTLLPSEMQKTGSSK